jgi:hypothetical protein
MDKNTKILLAVVAVAAIGYVIYQKRKTATKAPTSSTPATTTTNKDEDFDWTSTASGAIAVIGDVFGNVWENA